MADIEKWLGKERIVGKTVIDIGSGSGIHSLSFSLLGAERVHSIDVDPVSVEATDALHHKMQNSPQWTVSQGSILDNGFVKRLGTFDIVYAWGVFHHTGSMWEAIANASSLVKPDGLFWFSIYAKGPRHQNDLALKRRYNAASPFRKRLMEARWIFGLMRNRLFSLKNPFAWNEKKERGMTVYHDIVDWLGGLPYEVADESEILRFMRECGFILEDLKVVAECGCSIYLFSRRRMN